MNKKLKAFIYALIISVVCFIIALITFGQSSAFGLIPLALGLFFLFRYAIPALKQYRQETGKIPYCTSEEAIWIKCEQYITQYEKSDNLGASSCVNEVMPLIKQALKTSPPPNENLDKTAHTLLSNITFRLLSSGQYHIYAGTLNIMGCAPSLMRVYETCTKWLLDNKYITEEQYAQGEKNLRENIKEVG